MPTPTTLIAGARVRHGLIATVTVMGLWAPNDMLGASSPRCQPDVLQSHLISAARPLGTTLLAAARQAAATRTAWTSPGPEPATAADGGVAALGNADLRARVARYRVTAPAPADSRPIALSAIAESGCELH